MENFYEKFGLSVFSVVMGTAGIYGIAALLRDHNCLPAGMSFFEKKEPIQLDKKLCHKDEILVELLRGKGQEAWVVTDPDLEDNPIIFASSAFCKLTGYNKNEILNRNCRFLQGAKTDRQEVAKVRTATHESSETAACFTNYRKDGSPFQNQLYITPLHTPDGKVAYFLGLTTKVDEKAADQGKGGQCKSGDTKTDNKGDTGKIGKDEKNDGQK